MVDVGQKDPTDRLARAAGQLRMRAETLNLIRNGEIEKGDVLGVARLAAIMAAKRTDELIPLCHSLSLTSVDVSFDFPDDQTIGIQASIRTRARTGVEMEALTAVTVAALTIYDMCKAVDRDIVIQDIHLEEKLGGKSGHYVRSSTPADSDTDQAPLS